VIPQTAFGPSFCLGMSEIDNDTPAAASGPIPFSSALELRRLSAEMAANARQQLDIVSRSLDPRVYDTEEFISAVKQLVLTPRSRVRILLLDPAALLARGGHRLVELAIRVSSHMEIRRVGPDQSEFNEAMMIADRSGAIYREYSDRHDGIANFHDRLWAARLSESFESLWQNALPDPNFRRLML